MRISIDRAYRKVYRLSDSGKEWLYYFTYTSKADLIEQLREDFCLLKADGRSTYRTIEKRFNEFMDDNGSH